MSNTRSETLTLVAAQLWAADKANNSPNGCYAPEAYAHDAVQLHAAVEVAMREAEEKRDLEGFQRAEPISGYPFP